MLRPQGGPCLPLSSLTCPESAGVTKVENRAQPGRSLPYWHEDLSTGCVLCVYNPYAPIETKGKFQIW